MPTYNTVVTRGVPTSPDPFISDKVASQIIKELPEQSAVLARARKVRIPAKVNRIPVMSALPQAYWVTGDTGMKQTTKAEWKNLTLTAEELAAIVVIPDAYFDDAEMPIWDETRPYIVQAIGAAIDGAALFGTNKPASWPNSIYTGTLASGNTIVEGAGSTQLWQNVATLGSILATDGYNLDGFVSQPGFNWKLAGLKDGDNRPIYQSSISEGIPDTLYGRPLNEVKNGAWDSSEAELIGGDWTKAIVGIRQDITFKVFTEGVVSDDSGNVLVNLMQQDSKAMRVVMRVGFAIANPVTALNSVEASRYPFATLQATTANS